MDKSLTKTNKLIESILQKINPVVICLISHRKTNVITAVLYLEMLHAKRSGYMGNTYKDI